MDALLVDQVDVLGAAVVALQDLNVVFLDAGGLLDDAVVGPGDLLAEELLPFLVTERDLVQRLQLAAQVGDQVGLAADAQVFVGLYLQALDEVVLKLRLGLVAFLAYLVRAHEFRDDGAFVGKRNRFVAGGLEVFAHAASRKVSRRSR